ncbi:MAG: amidohydrolase family protein [Bacteroidota bacterium]|nr:amidohydrolase family protein [Bacteroidota bacterium]
MNPDLLPAIVKKAHDDGYRVSAHVASSDDFHNALTAGVDEINHLPLALISETDAELAAKNKTVIVTTTSSHRPLGEIKNIDQIHTANLKLLKTKGVIIAIGTDNGDKTSLDEIMNIKNYNIFDNAELLEMWTKITTEAIYPGKNISQIKDGYESNFLVLAGSPIENFDNVKNISMRVKSGHIIKVKEIITKPSINEAIDHKLMLNGVGAAIDEYKKLKSEEAENYDFSEQQLNALGYELIKRKLYADAIEIFKLNIGQFPNSSNAYDSLSEAYLLTGNKDLALQNYAKSVELNPKNENGKKVLDELRK